MDTKKILHIGRENISPVFSLFLLWTLAFLSIAEPIMAALPDAYEPDNHPGEAQNIGRQEVFNQPHTFHEFFDQDWVQFTATKNYTYEIQANSPSSNCDPVIELYFSDRTSLMLKQNNSGPGIIETLHWRCPENGIYFVRFTNNSIHYGSDIKYKISLAPVVFGPTFNGYVKGKVTSGGLGVAKAKLTGGGGVGISHADGTYIMSLGASTVTVNVRKDAYYPNSFTVTVANDQTVHHDVSLTKIPTPNRPPTISGSPETSVRFNELYSFVPTASDPDGDQITFSISNKPEWAHFNPDNGMLAGIPGGKDVGTYSSVTIRVTDSQGKSASMAPFDLLVLVLTPGIYLLLDENTQ